MNEAEWMNCKDPEKMLNYLLGKRGWWWQRIPLIFEPWKTRIDMAKQKRPSSRKCRLFACACCRRIWDWLTDGRSRDAVEISERYVEGLAEEEELQGARIMAWVAVRALDDTPSYAAAGSGGAKLPGRLWIWEARAAAETAGPDAARAALAVSVAVERAGVEQAIEGLDLRKIALVVGAKTRANLIRDIFGNPFHPVFVDHSCLRPKVLNLSKEIYDECAFDRMAELGDVLQKAGCKSAVILDHCRQRLHVRGCWLLDMILGKD